MIAILFIFIIFRVYNNGWETFSDPMTLLFVGGIVFDLIIITGIAYLFQKYRTSKLQQK